MDPTKMVEAVLQGADPARLLERHIREGITGRKPDKSDYYGLAGYHEIFYIWDIEGTVLEGSVILGKGDSDEPGGAIDVQAYMNVPPDYEKEFYFFSKEKVTDSKGKPDQSKAARLALDVFHACRDAEDVEDAVAAIKAKGWTPA